MLYYDILLHTIIKHNILYYDKLCHAIIYHTMPHYEAITDALEEHRERLDLLLEAERVSGQKGLQLAEDQRTNLNE